MTKDRLETGTLVEIEDAQMDRWDRHAEDCEVCWPLDAHSDVPHCVVGAGIAAQVQAVSAAYNILLQAASHGLKLNRKETLAAN